jgi:hypothetical protein
MGFYRADKYFLCLTQIKILECLNVHSVKKNIL